MNRKQLIFAAKLAISFGIIAGIYFKVLGRDGAAELWKRLSNLSWPWVAFGVVMQLTAIGCSIARWRLLLRGQGIHAPLRHLIGSFMIGRFFGGFAPGGWTGLNGYRLYDIATHTGKVARSTATIGIEMLLGWIAFGAVIIGGSIFGLRFLGVTGVVLIDGVFLGLIVTAIVLVSKPKLFRLLAARAPKQIEGKLRTIVDAACAYEGKGWLVAQATLFGVGTHFFGAFIYVAAAHALHADLGVGEIFFGTSLQIFATLVPASVNGIGLREATAVALYARVGVPHAVAMAFATLGFLIEMFVSAFGGAVFMARRVGYEVSIHVEHPEHEEIVHAAVPPVPREEWPRLSRALWIGLSSGLLAGLLLGLGEAIVILRASSAAPDYGVLAYAALSYPLFIAPLAVAASLSLSLLGRLMRRRAFPEPNAFAHYTALFVALPALAIGAFRVRRDVFHEELVWKSPHGLQILALCAGAALLLFALLSLALRLFSSRSPVVLRAWCVPALWLVVLAGLHGFALAKAPSKELPALTARKAADPGSSNVLFIVVDTMRADHLPSYGYTNGSTPSLDAFAHDAVRFDAAFANASWTRPSFASILSGRYPSSHRTMAKSDSLPDELVTMPEALRDAGYATYGVVTNFNIAPFFNFHQGFDHYHYLEPAFVLGANDSAAKLLFVQFMRQRIETMRAKSGHVEVGSAYQDAGVVNETVTEILGHASKTPSTPWFLFVGYMDPHDPYYPHPYDGTAYSRAAHQEPEAGEADELRKLYDGEIAFWDKHFGELVAELKKRKLYDDLTIVITADHGEEFQEHGGFWHGTTLYDEELHVPLFVKLPKQQLGGNVISHWVQSIDLMPSLLKLLHVAVPKGVQGQNVFDGSDHLFAEESHEGNVLRALRSRRAGTQIKLITANAGNPRGLAESELYRVDQDPREQVNLSSEDPKLTDTMRVALEQQEKDAATGRAAQRSVDVNADAAAAEKLRALGYAGGDKTK